jgi:cobalt-zinc-cadmium efflux system outer membrane protein
MRYIHQAMSAFRMKAKIPHRHGRAVVYALVLALGQPVLAAEIGLADVVDQAWRLHPQAAGLAARDAEARAAQDVASGLTPEPASISLGNLNDKQGRNTGRQEWEVELAVPLWLPGQRAARVIEADSRLGETGARRAAVKLEIAGEVREAWWSLAAARAARALAGQRVDTARALDRDVQKRFKVGELSRIDANLAQGEVLAAEAEAIETQAALLQAEQAFRLLTGNDAPAELREEAPGRQPPVDAAAPASHPQLAAFAAAARTARARVRLAEETPRAAPELALRLVRERGDFNESYGNSVGVKLTIPFSSGAQLRRDTSGAQADAEQAEAEMRRVESRVQLDGERARQTLIAAERQLTMAGERRQLAADNLRLAEKSFTLGEADLATLLRLRAAAFEAESFHDRQRLARAAAISRLNQAQGVLP